MGLGSTETSLNLAAWSAAEFMDQKEIEKMSTRRKIAVMLLDGATYKEIERTLKVSSQTISKVSKILKHV